MAICVSDGAVHNDLKALDLIHFGFAIQAASTYVDENMCLRML